MEKKNCDGQWEREMEKEKILRKRERKEQTASCTGGYREKKTEKISSKSRVEGEQEEKKGQGSGQRWRKKQQGQIQRDTMGQEARQSDRQE